MTETMAEPTLGAGSTITSIRQLTDLPVGSVISGRRGNETKIDNDMWSRGADHSRSSREFRPDTYTYTVVSVGNGPAVEPAVGGVVTSEMFGSLPHGTVIRRDRAGVTTTWTRTSGGWDSSGGQSRTPENMRTDLLYRIVSLPAPVEPVDTTIETPMPGTQAAREQGEETLEEFKARFRTTVYAAQQSAGVNRTPVTNALRKLGVETTPTVAPGMPVTIADARLVGELPVGTVLTWGQDPTKFREYALYGKTHNGDMVKMLGGADPDYYTVLRAIIVPGVEAVERTPCSESEHQQIREFMARAWEVGVQAKESQGWCGEYERAMERCGINASVAHEPSRGQTAEQVAALPEGTILRVCLGATSSVLYIRDDSADNPAKTRRLGGSLAGSWAQWGMIPVNEPEQTMSIPVLSPQEMDGMPVGTTVGEGSSRWTRREPNPSLGDNRRCWFSGDYSYRSNQFNITNLRYMVIPR